MVEDPKQRGRIISSVHDSCHLGLNRTNDMLACKYYWPGMSKHVASYVSFITFYNCDKIMCVAYLMQIASCEKCQRNIHRLKKSAGSLHPIPVQPKFWHQVGMDVIGPLPLTPRGNKYIVTLTDYFTK